MAVLPAGDWLRTSFPIWRGMLALLAVGFATASGRAQDNVYYSPKTGFRIPFQVDPGDRRVRDVLLHVSEDLGRSYTRVASARPGDQGFNFQASHDGWYYFTVQTRDQDNRLYPTTLVGAAPGLKVYVDTTPPDVVLRTMAGAKPNEIGVEWDIRDDMLDVSSLRLEYRGRGQVWTRRGIPLVPNGQLSFDPGTPWSGRGALRQGQGRQRWREGAGGPRRRHRPGPPSRRPRPGAYDCPFRRPQGEQSAHQPELQDRRRRPVRRLHRRGVAEKGRNALAEVRQGGRTAGAVCRGGGGRGQVRLHAGGQERRRSGGASAHRQRPAAGLGRGRSRPGRW